MKAEDYVEVFNQILEGKAMLIKDKIFSIISDFLTENNIKNSDKLIYLMIANPELLNIALPKVIQYYRVRYAINSIIYNNKTILYYVTTKNNY